MCIYGEGNYWLFGANICTPPAMLGGEGCGGSISGGSGFAIVDRSVTLLAMLNKPEFSGHYKIY